MQFDFVKTDIVNMTSDAIVLPANTGLKEGSGASAAIFKAAGRKRLTTACRKIGNCEVGSAVPTLAYDLDAKYIIHAVVPKWIDGSHNEYGLLSSAYLSSLRAADLMGCSTIAFPLLASGNNGFDRELTLEIAIKSIESFEGTNLKKAVIVLFGEKVTSFVRTQGYEVIEIPEDLKKEEKKQARRDKIRKIFDSSAAIAEEVFDQQLQNVQRFLDDPENRKKIVALATRIVNKALESI